MGRSDRWHIRRTTWRARPQRLEVEGHAWTVATFLPCLAAEPRSRGSRVQESRCVSRVQRPMWRARRNTIRTWPTGPPLSLRLPHAPPATDLYSRRAADARARALAPIPRSSASSRRWSSIRCRTNRPRRSRSCGRSIPTAIRGRSRCRRSRTGSAMRRRFESLAAYRHVDYSFKGTGDPQNVPALRATPDLFTVLKSQRRRSAARSPRTKASSAPIASSCSATASGRARSAADAGSHRADHSTRLRAVHRRRRDAAGVRIPDQHQRRSVDAAGVRSEGPARAIAPGAIADGGRPDGDGVDAAAGAGRDQRARGRIATEFKDSNAGWSARVVAAQEQLVGASRPALMVLMGAVGFLLLIVCANMANLLLARLSSRRREMAVRGALGASRWEVARPIIAESLMLSFIGGALGLIARLRRTATARRRCRKPAAAHGSTAARWRRAAVHDRGLDRRRARVWIDPGAARIASRNCAT